MQKVVCLARDTWHTGTPGMSGMPGMARYTANLARHRPGTRRHWHEPGTARHATSWYGTTRLGTARLHGATMK